MGNLLQAIENDIIELFDCLFPSNSKQYHYSTISQQCSPYDPNDLTTTTYYNHNATNQSYYGHLPDQLYYVQPPNQIQTYHQTQMFDPLYYVNQQIVQSSNLPNYQMEPVYYRNHQTN